MEEWKKKREREYSERYPVIPMEREREYPDSYGSYEDKEKYPEYPLTKYPEPEYRVYDKEPYSMPYEQYEPENERYEYEEHYEDKEDGKYYENERVWIQNKNDNYNENEDEVNTENDSRNENVNVNDLINLIKELQENKKDETYGAY